MRFALPAVALALLLGGCDIGAGNGSSAEGGAKNLEVTRDDGSPIDLPQRVRAWCAQEKEFKETDSTEQELFVLVGEFPIEEEKSLPPFLIFAHPTKAIERMPKFQLRDEGVGYPSLFVFDSRSENELSSSTEHAKGSFEVEEWGCDKADPVRISFDATLDSEFFEGGTVDVNGEIVTVIGAAPASPE